MSFTTLADRYEQRSKDIYGRFAASSDQAVVVKPNTNESRSRIKDDNRAIPVVSVIRDTRRVSSFLTSPEGILFLGKQTLLQTANTFANTKLYNPASPLLNVVPFLHTKRHLSTSTVAGEAPGVLQNNTVNDVTSRFQISGQLQALSSGRRGLLPVVGSIAKTYLATKLKNAASTVLPIPQTYASSRPEYKVFTDATGPVVFEPQPLSQRGVVKTSVKATVVATLVDNVRKKATADAVVALNNTLPRSIRNTIPLPTPETDTRAIPTFVQAATAFRQKFYDRTEEPIGTRIKNKYFNESTAGASDVGENPSSTVNGSAKSGPTILKDPYNIAPFVLSSNANVVRYDNIQKPQAGGTDIIKFIFKEVDGTKPVHFRALLASIKENVKPEFTEQRYVGRTERFVTYSGAKRGLSLMFNIVAFSEEEADGMWTKVNYLTGLAFPKGVTNGFMVPPLFKMTIGGLYDNQPCYIESLDYDFLDETITFDTDKEVPFAINVNMQLSILEKRSKFHDTPFYKITEDANDNAFSAIGNQRGATTVQALPTRAAGFIPTRSGLETQRLRQASTVDLNSRRG